jgi:hypothetical protein
MSMFSFVLGVDGDSNLQIGDYVGGNIRASLDVASVCLQPIEVKDDAESFLSSPTTPTDRSIRSSRSSPGRRMAAAELEWVDSVLLKVMKERIKDVMQREMRKTIDQNAAALAPQLLTALSQLSDGTTAQVKRVAKLQSLMPREPDPESLLQQKLSAVQQALESEVTRAKAAQKALAETEPSLSAQISEAHGEYISRVCALEAQVAAAAASHDQVMMSTDPPNPDKQQLLLLHLAGIEQALDAEKTNRAAAEAALSLPRLFAETLQAAMAKRVDAFMCRKTAKLKANTFVGWGEVVAFEVMQRRSTAEALASEVIAAEEAAKETQAKMSAAHDTRTSSLAQEVESLRHQLALAHQKLSTVDVAQSLAAQERLEVEVRREEVAHSEVLANQAKQHAIWRDEITEVHRQELTALQQALEAEMKTKELLVDKSLSTDAVAQDIEAQPPSKLEARTTALQLDWQVAIDTFEDGIRQIGGRDQLSQRAVAQLTQVLRMELASAQKKLEGQQLRVAAVPAIARHTRKKDGQQYDFLDSDDIAAAAPRTRSWCACLRKWCTSTGTQ